MLCDRDTDKCFDTDITEYLDKYHKKRINKYRAKLINKHKNKRINKYKTKYIKKYILQPLPQVQPSHHSHAIVTLPRHRLHTAPTPPPHCSNQLSRHPDAAPLQPPCNLHDAPTSPQRCSSCCNAAPRSLHTTATLTQPSRCPHVVPAPLHAALTQLSSRLNASFMV